MEVVPTNDGDEDDGVIWFRCPQCQGFLPKLSGADLVGEGGAAENHQQDSEHRTTAVAPATADAGAEQEWDSPADMMAAEKSSRQARGGEPDPFLPEDEAAGGDELPDDLGDDFELPLDLIDDGDDEDAPAAVRRGDDEGPRNAAEPIHEFTAMLAAADAAAAVPYRPWETYEVGQCIHHLAWDDCGVVVAKEDLPGGRRIIKCYFDAAGVVRLIEQAPR